VFPCLPRQFQSTRFDGLPARAAWLDSWQHVGEGRLSFCSCGTHNAQLRCTAAILPPDRIDDVSSLWTSSRSQGAGIPPAPSSLSSFRPLKTEQTVCRGSLLGGDIAIAGGVTGVVIAAGKKQRDQIEFSWAPGITLWRFSYSAGASFDIGQGR
jgi:hypothetical protein